MIQTMTINLTDICPVCFWYQPKTIWYVCTVYLMQLTRQPLLGIYCVRYWFNTQQQKSDRTPRFNMHYARNTHEEKVRERQIDRQIDKKIDRQIDREIERELKSKEREKVKEKREREVFTHLILCTSEKRMIFCTETKSETFHVFHVANIDKIQMYVIFVNI